MRRNVLPHSTRVSLRSLAHVCDKGSCYLQLTVWRGCLLLLLWRPASTQFVLGESKMSFEARQLSKFVSVSQQYDHDNVD